MQNHTKVYMQFFGFQIAEDCSCEILGCGKPCIDIHHIEPRSKFGNKTKDQQDNIKNLIGLCREHHDDAHANKISKGDLSQTHLNFIYAQGKIKQISVNFEDILNGKANT